MDVADLVSRLYDAAKSRAEFSGYLYTNLLSLCATNEAFYYVDHVHDGIKYRVFTYRLASYTDFLSPAALECRGHTFRWTPYYNVDELDEEGRWELASMPMEKFFNLGENPMTMDLDLSRVVRVEDKRDGSLISSVNSLDGKWTVKSKTSFSSQQARDALEWLNNNPKFAAKVAMWTLEGHTVNMEWTAPDNQIVLGYSEPSLRVLNIRCVADGSYVTQRESDFTIDEWVDEYPLPEGGVTEEWLTSLRAKTGIEGVILWFDDGMKVKVKTDWYSNLHLQKEQVSNPRRLFESVIMEQSDDLKTLFLADPQSIARIEEMEAKAKALYNRLHRRVEEFYDDNHTLSRKDYAILGQQELKADGVFSQAMNLYLGKDMGLKEHLIKNYKQYGIVDTSVESSDE